MIHTDKQIQKASSLLHAATGLRTMAKKFTSQQKQILEVRALGIDKMVNEIAAGLEGRYKRDIIESYINRERVNAEQLYSDVQEEHLPNIVTSYMNEVKKFEAEKGNPEQIIADLLS